jgi:hypothetical protein
MDKALLDELSTNMVSSFNVKFSSSGILNIDGERITLTSFPEWFMRYCREEHTKKFMPLMLDSVNSSVFLETLKVSLKKSMSSGKKAAFREISDLVKPYDYCDAIPFINIVDHKMIMFYDKKQRKLLREQA